VASVAGAASFAGALAAAAGCRNGACWADATVKVSADNSAARSGIQHALDVLPVAIPWTPDWCVPMAGPPVEYLWKVAFCGTPSTAFTILSMAMSS
jgi:hypothetical protein